MNVVYFILGGNLGDRMANIILAEKILAQMDILILESSSFYETEPWGMEKSPNFLNRVIKTHTPKSAFDVLDVCLRIENEFGRKRNKNKFTSREMDVDVLFFNSEIIKTDQLEIPHPRLHLRKFVLIPLLEIAPDLIHPVFKKDLKTLINECDDTLNVNKI